MSSVVPGDCGATSVIGLDGYCSCERAGPPRATIAVSTTARTYMSFISSPCYFAAAAAGSGENDGPHRRGFRPDELQRQRHQGHAPLGDTVQVGQIGQGHDAGLAQRARRIEDARRARLVDPVIEVVAHQHDALVDAPTRTIGTQIGCPLHPMVDHVGLVDIGAQEQAVATTELGAHRLLQLLGSDGLAGHEMPQVRDDRVAGEYLQGQILDLLAALDVVLGRIDMAAGMQAHVHAAHDLPGSFRSVVLLEDFHLELHVPLESRGRAHGELRVVELETDVDDLSDRQRHEVPLTLKRAYDLGTRAVPDLISLRNAATTRSTS